MHIAVATEAARRRVGRSPEAANVNGDDFTCPVGKYRRKLDIKRVNEDLKLV